MQEKYQVSIKSTCSEGFSKWRLEGRLCKAELVRYFTTFIISTYQQASRKLVWLYLSR